jgi:hypothetical protein
MALPSRSGPVGERARPTVRIVAVYGTSWAVPESAQLTPVSDHLDIAGFLAAALPAQLPAVLAQASHEPSLLRTPRGHAGEHSLEVTTWLFVLPSARLVAALALDAEGTPEELRPLLADLVEGDAEVDGHTLTEVFAMSAGSSGGLAPERHVIASFGDTDGLGTDARTVRSLLYPTSPVEDSAELVIHRSARGAEDGALWVGPLVTVAARQPAGLDNALVLSAILAVGAATRLREIHAAAFDAAGRYRAANSELRSTHESRRFLEGIANRIGDLEVELAFSVDAVTDAGAILPHPPVESYHRALVGALDLSDRALAVGRILTRLAQGVAAELAAVASAEWRIEDRRRSMWNALVMVLALVGIPAAIAIGYAGREGGYTDDDDVNAYIIAGVGALVLVLAYAVVAGAIRRRTHRHRE